MNRSVGPADEILQEENEEDLDKRDDWPTYGRARFNAKHHLIYDCRENPGKRYYFKICDRKERDGGDGYIYWKCMSCNKLKQYRNVSETTVQRVVPKIAIKRGLIYTDPQYPREPHFCEPVPTSLIARLTPQRLRKKEEQLRNPFARNIYVAEVDRGVELLIAASRGAKKTRKFSKVGLIGPHPVHIECPRCGRLITTVIRMRPGRCSWIGCVGCCMTGCCLGCCLFPFRMNTCQDVAHHCPLCRFPVGKYRRGFGYSNPFPFVPSDDSDSEEEDEHDSHSQQDQTVCENLPSTAEDRQLNGAVNHGLASNDV